MSPRRGFTLVELIIALAIGGMVVMTGARLFGELTDGVRRIDDARMQLDREANAHRMLAHDVGSMDVSASGHGFSGRHDVVAFSTWDTRARPWPTLRDVMLRTASRRLVRIANQDTLTVFFNVDSVSLDYLLHAGAAESWTHQWISPSSAPVCIRMRLWRSETVDTILLPIGARG